MFRITRLGLDLIKLMGAFLLFGAILMFFASVASMWESWENIKMVNQCLSVANSDPTFFEKCEAASLSSLDVYVRLDQQALNGKQLCSALIPPIFGIFWWIAVGIFAWVIYHSDRFFSPANQPVRPFAKKKR